MAIKYCPFYNPNPTPVDVRSQIHDLSRGLPGKQGAERDEALKAIGRLSGDARRLELEISAEVVAQTDVVCATCIGAGSELLMASLFMLVVVDEATQCSEPEALVGLARAHSDAQVGK